MTSPRLLALCSIFIMPVLGLCRGPTSAHSTSTNDDSDLLSTRLPTFISLLPNINDFGQFADGGPDGNWYVGFNNAWIVKLPPAPLGNFTRAFIGAKMGRAKSQAKSGKPWEREALPGKIYMAISQTPSFSSEQSFFLAATSDIPLEPDPRVYTPGSGQSQWFWTEVPLASASTTEPNYLVVWSPTENFTGAASAPILAAGGPGGSRDISSPQAWLNQNIQGVPPRTAIGALETPINNLSPALAIKLVPLNDAAVGIHECSAGLNGTNYIFRFSVDAENADLAWLEISQDQLDWQRISAYLRHPPYAVTFPQDRLPARGAYVRAVARDVLGNTGNCDPIFIGRPGR